MAALTASRASERSAAFCGSLSIGEPAKRGGKISDDAVVVAGNFTGVGILQDAAVSGAEAARCFHHRNGRPSSTRNVSATLVFRISLEKIELAVGIEC